MGGIVSALPRIQESSNEESSYDPSSRVNRIPIRSQISKDEPEEPPLDESRQKECLEKQQIANYEKWDADRRRNHEISMEMFQRFNQQPLNQYNLSQQPS